MKFLPAGTTKYLYFDQAEVIRNAQRRNKAAPVVLVTEVVQIEGAPDAHINHSGLGLMTESAVRLAYNQTGRLCEYTDPYTRRRYAQRIAFVTDGAVAIAETAAEAESLAYRGGTADATDSEDDSSSNGAGSADSTATATVAKPTVPSKKKPTIKTEEVKPNGEEQ